MSHSKLLLPDKEPQKHGNDTSTEALLRKRNGLGNQDLLAALGSPKAMPESVKVSMEKSLGSDFSNVRLYESSLVEQAGAQAAASGNHVAFAPGKMDFHSQAGLELLGHELSHVVSQRRGEVSGSGLVHNSSLEHKADADGLRAMSAFDADLGSDLTPINVGPAPVSSAGPIQAKKKKSAGERFIEGFDDLDLAQQVTAARNMAVIGSFSGYDGYDESEHNAYIDRMKTVTPEFMDELLRQQIADAQGLVDAKQSRINDMGMTEDEATFKTKYSHEAMLFQGYSSLAKDISMRAGNENALLYYMEQSRQLLREQPELRQIVKAAQEGILSGNERWGDAPENSDEAKFIQNASEDMTKTFVKNWKRPQKRSIWQRLFHRK